MRDEILVFVLSVLIKKKTVKKEIEHFKTI